MSRKVSQICYFFAMVIVGLTRRQKQEYLAVLKRSRTELVSPNSSTASKNNADAESTDSEFVLGKKKKNKKKMVIESEDESSIILFIYIF